MEKTDRFWMCIALALLFILVNCYFYDRHEKKMMNIVTEGINLQSKIGELENRITKLEGKVWTMPKAKSNFK